MTHITRIEAAGGNKSRVWSSAITTMTRPRKRSIESFLASPGGEVLAIQGVAGSKDTTAVGLAVRHHPKLLDTACPFR